MYGFAALLAGSPFRHRFDKADGLFVQTWVGRAHYLYIVDAAVFAHGKLYDDTSLYAVFLRDNRVFDVFAEIFHQLFLTAGEFGHFFYYYEYHVLFGVFFDDGHRCLYHFLHLVLVVFGVDLNVFGFYIVIYNLNLFDDVGCRWWWRWRGLLFLNGLFNHFFFEKYFFVGGLLVNGYLFVRPFKRHIKYTQRQHQSH